MKLTWSTLGLHTFLTKLSWKVGCAFALAFATSQILIGLILGPKAGATIIEAQLAFTQERFSSVVNQWSSSDVLSFKNHFYLDFIHPLWYGVLLAWMLAKSLPSHRRTLVWLPVIAAMGDVIENTIHSVAAFGGAFTDLGQPMIALASICAAIKWLLVIVSLVIFFVYFRTFLSTVKSEVTA